MLDCHRQVADSSPGLRTVLWNGAIAQLVERLLCKQDVVGSTPSGSTRNSLDRNQVRLRLYQPAVIDIVKEERIRPLIGFQDTFEKKTLSDKNQAWTPGISFQSAGASMHEFC